MRYVGADGSRRFVQLAGARGFGSDLTEIRG